MAETEEDYNEEDDRAPTPSKQEHDKRPKECPWPAPLERAAFHGLAGEFVTIIEPHSEADPAALLVSFLTAFGNVAGRHAYVRAEADRHYGNTFLALVGETSKGRKGTSWGHVRRLFGRVAPEWVEKNIAGGLASGEGLIYAVRDPIEKEGKVRDEGVTDKRLLVYESEFAGPLQVLKREGNTLSPILRAAWDSGDLRNLVKNSPLRASGAHVSVITHITRGELRGAFRAIDFANGFANRFQWVAVRRSKILPRGGNVRPEDLAQVETLLRAAIRFASWG